VYATPTFLAAISTAFMLLLGCGNGSGRGDRFLEGATEAPSWAETPDHRVRLPLVHGLTWERTAPSKEVLLKMRAAEGPTFVVVAAVDYGPKPVALGNCAEAHRAKISTAAIVGGVKMTDPTVHQELRRGINVPRLDYAVPLEATNADAPRASALTAWTYLADLDRCVAIGVTTVVKGKASQPTEPEPEDLQRFERVFGAIADEATVAK
jgi:hypothetical protein